MRVMPLWRLEPNARLHDPRWLDHEFRQPILVDAANPARARRKATQWYIERHQRDGDRGQFDRSAFEDEKLYKVERIDISPYNPETLENLVTSVYPYIRDQNPGLHKQRAKNY